MFLGIPKNAVKSILSHIQIPKNREKNRFWEDNLVFGSVFGKIDNKFRKGFHCMRKKNYKGRCEKRSLGKCSEICRTYDSIQNAYATFLQDNDNIASFRCNVLLENLSIGEYTTDFLCTRTNGDLLVRECVNRKHLSKPLTVKLLDESKLYWLRRGVTDWGLVINEE